MKYNAIRDMCLATKRKSMWGYDGGRYRNMVQFVFKTQEQMRKAKFALKKSHQIYESSVDPIVRVYHLRKLNPAGWVRIERAYSVRERISSSDIELETSFQSVFPSDNKSVPPLVIASEY
jgi:DNA polymerase delta subunit 1